MKNEFEEYLNSINASEVVKNSVNECIKDVEWLYSLEIKDIFVNTNMDKGSVVYSSLFLFTESHVVECKSFMNLKDYDLACFFKGIQYIDTKLTDFSEEGMKSENALVNISVIFIPGNLTSDFFAVGQNCKTLVDLAKKYLYININK